MADISQTPIRVELADEAATAALAARVASRARPGDVFALYGPLGSGKTVFARAFINARTRTPEEVPSPTFILVQGYEFPNGEGAIPVYHFDLFRIKDALETAELGMDDAFAGGISLIEWPDRLGARLPADRLEVSLDQGPSPDSRRASLAGHGTWKGRLEILGPEVTGDD
ncbi:MAG: tRNA (adenosine(37)-N6)-threonylcarbamoyltransferase complex ATPase subunit type 1 TsaE [Rhodospirillaceae bacterium]|jgi:tRNA threonylcarbamoyladenosine biosynthesis protein TsaE|nr:tRNA (adenosine(37)-N6)-threonylcarbamoyltransferase complex ATPase subunit type 1 TsaE [Rhodospirillaceae bacterium]|tara:strand:- start:1621 stop:2130 length:510 start_codon:yes stop_codon:yes gene_type:complete